MLGIDEPAVDGKGNKIPPLAGKPINTYGWRSSVNLGQHDPTRAAVSPEAMAYFASAIYLREWHWASGTAKKEAEKDDFDPVSSTIRTWEMVKLTMNRLRLIRRSSENLLGGKVVVLMRQMATHSTHLLMARQ